MHLIDGTKIAAQLMHELEKEIALSSNRKPGSRKPGLAFILVGNHPASQIYVSAKKRACAKVGIHSLLLEFPSTMAQSDLLEQIEKLNRDATIDGILVQLPLPPHINEQAVTLSIDPAKDVDGFHPLNMGKMLLGDDSAILPCTPHGIQVLLERSHISTSGKHVVIVGRSNIVGKPLAVMLMQKKQGANATVTVCHSQSENLPEILQSADILVAAVGKAKFIQKQMVKKGIVIIDVGISRSDGQIVGDVDFENVAPLASHITPVPGGVGPMTIAMLLQNTFTIYKKNFL
jgi:methylenetetrahydrofolate dehydrogenase (NADP+) / methenyltetrahydrofolate cyclohydrolase